MQGDHEDDGQEAKPRHRRWLRTAFVIVVIVVTAGPGRLILRAARVAQAAMEVRAGEKLLHECRYTEAEERFARAISIRRYYPWAQSLRTVAACESRRQQANGGVAQPSLATDTHRAYALTWRGWQHLREDRLQEGIADCEEALRLNPWDSAARFTLGQIADRQNRQVDAVAECRKCLEIEPSHAYALICLGGVLFHTGRLDEAFDVYRETVRRWPEWDEGYWGVAAVMAQRGQLGEAIEQYQAALELDTGDWPVRTALADALERAGRAEEAALHLRYIVQCYPRSRNAHRRLAACLVQLGKYEDALAEARRATAIGPDSAEIRVIAGNALLDAKRFDEATEEFAHALQLDGNSTEARLGHAEVLFCQGKRDEAISRVREAGKRTTDAWSQIQIAEALDLYRAPWQEVEQAYRRAVETDLSNAEYRAALGAFLGRHLKVAEGLALLRQAVREAPCDVWCRERLAETLEHPGYWPEAAEEWRKAAELDPYNDRLFYQFFYLCDRGFGRYDEAQALIEKALGHRPDSAKLHVRLADVLSKRGTPEQAMREFLTAMDLAPGDEWTIRDMGYFAAASRRNADVAEPGVRKLVEASPGDLHVRIAWCRVLCSQRRYGDAVKAFSDALRLDPNGWEVDGVIQDIDGGVSNNVGPLLTEISRQTATNPSDAGLHSLKGVALEAAVRSDDAMAEYRQAISLDPSLTLARTRLAKLQAIVSGARGLPT
jgi:tetratricopeptide (TPR) repeat protein